MTDEQLEAIEHRVTSAVMLYDMDANDVFYPDVLHDYSCDGELLLDEVKRLRTENAAMREIVQAVVAKRPQEWDGGGLDVVLQPPDLGLSYTCPWCDGHVVRAVPSDENKYTGVVDFIHTPDCPISKARTILAAESK